MFVKQNETVNTLALGWDSAGLKILSRAAVEKHKEIKAFLTHEWGKAEEAKDKARRDLIWRIHGCLDKLGAVLLQLLRLKGHVDSLELQAQMMPKGVTAALHAEEACWDFEGLLLQSRAALDRLTWFVADRFGQKCNSFSRLEAILKGVKQKHTDADQLYQLVANCRPIEAAFVDGEGYESLRSFVAHRGGVSEAVENHFQITRVSAESAILVDCESYGIPVLETAKQAGQYIPYLILNSLSVIAGLKPLDMNQFHPPWKTPIAVLSKHISQTTGTQFLYVSRMTPDGVEMKTVYVTDTLFLEALNTREANS